MLAKKLMIYKMMGSDIFINNAIPLMNLTFKLLGQRASSILVNQTAGSVFTSGENEFSLVKDIRKFKERKVGGIGNYVVEGMHKYNDALVKTVMTDLKRGMDAITHNGAIEGHLAIKYTSFCSTETMIKYNTA